MIKLAIIGTGNMAKQHAIEFAKIKGVSIIACCDVDATRAKAFAEAHKIPYVFTNAAKMMDELELDAVTIVTPDAAHKPVALEAAKHGLHILCEKPLAVNARDAKEMMQAARRRKLITMVNFSYRGSSALQKARELVAASRLGAITHVEASYMQGWLHRVSDAPEIGSSTLWRLSTKMGSNGTLGDIGVHIFDFATCVAGDIASLSCSLATFPKGVHGAKYKGAVLDANDSAAAVVRFRNGGVGCIHTTRWAGGHNNSIRLRVYGDKGSLVVDLDKSWSDLDVFLRSKDAKQAAWKTIKCAPTPNIYQRFVKSIVSGKNDQPDFETGWKVQQYLDACFASARKGKAVEI